MTLQDLVVKNREGIRRISEGHGAVNIRVFGSMARGGAGPDIDVDLLVDAGPNRTAFFPGGLIADLEELLGKRVQVVTAQALHWYVRDRILEEAVVL